MYDSTMLLFFLRQFWEKKPTGTRNDPVWGPAQMWGAEADNEAWAAVGTLTESTWEHSQLFHVVVTRHIFTVPEQSLKCSSKRRFCSLLIKSWVSQDLCNEDMDTLAPPGLLPWKFVQAPLSLTLHSLMALREQLVCQTNLSFSYKAIPMRSSESVAVKWEIYPQDSLHRRKSYNSNVTSPALLCPFLVCLFWVFFFLIFKPLIVIACVTLLLKLFIYPLTL